MNVTLLDVLQQANAIDILVKILEAQGHGPHATVRGLIFYSTQCHSMKVLGIVQSHLSNLLQPL